MSYVCWVHVWVHVWGVVGVDREHERGSEGASSEWVAGRVMCAQQQL